MQDSQLLAEEGVFREQVAAAARQVRQGTGQGVSERRLGDAAEKLMRRMGETIPDAFGTMDELIDHNWVCLCQARLIRPGGSSLAQPNHGRITGGWAR